ncbi:MAG: hypothetical protein WC319_06280 [Candidatus Paceibacterota bacterium]|jgi:hypothetical protein
MVKKPLKIFYFLACEGHTEYVIFSYLTRNRFRNEFLKSNVKFRDNINIIREPFNIISNGKIYGVGDEVNFKSKYNIIKEEYPKERFFFFLDKDLDDSSKIEAIIEKEGDIVQFIEYNSEYLLLKLVGFNPKEPKDFRDLRSFRDYSKKEFLKKFGKKAGTINDFDLDMVFQNISNEEIRKIFNKLFSILSK